MRFTQNDRRAMMSRRPRPAPPDTSKTPRERAHAVHHRRRRPGESADHNITAGTRKGRCEGRRCRARDTHIKPAAPTQDHPRLAARGRRHFTRLRIAFTSQFPRHETCMGARLTLLCVTFKLWVRPLSGNIAHSKVVWPRAVCAASCTTGPAARWPTALRAELRGRRRHTACCARICRGVRPSRRRQAAVPRRGSSGGRRRRQRDAHTDRLRRRLQRRGR